MSLSAPNSLASVTGGGGPLATDSFTPSALSLLMVLVLQAGTDAPVSVASDTFGGLAWEGVSAGSSDNADLATIFWAVSPASPSSGTVTVDGGSLHIQPWEITGGLTVAPVGATGQASSSDTINLSATPASDSEVVSLVVQYSSSASAWTDPSGYTNFIPYAGFGNDHWQAAYLNGGATQEIDWSGGFTSRVAGVAIEVLLTAPPPPTSLPGRGIRSVGAAANVLRSGIW